MHKFFFYIVGTISCLYTATSFITYTFVSVGNDAISLDDTQALIVLIGLIKMILLGSSGVFPVNLNKLIDKFLGRGRRNEGDNLYQLPPVTQFPCLRRLLCEVEAAARSSDSYNGKFPEEEVFNGRHPEEEVSPPQEDPITEIHIEAAKALYREYDPAVDMSPATRKAVGLMEGLTGSNCEEAYRRCPGRLTSKTYFKEIFEELDYEAVDEFSDNFI